MSLRTALSTQQVLQHPGLCRDPALQTNKQMNKKTNKIKSTEADNFYSALEYIS